MQDGAKLFGMRASEAVAMYLASITMLGMMQGEKLEHDGKDALEDAVVHWHAFCASRGIELATPKEALASLQQSHELKIL